MTKYSVGDVTFGLGADIRGLDKARSVMQQFGREVDRVASSQAQGANAAVAAMARQEAAMRRALNTTVQLQKELRNTGAPTSLLSQSTNSFNALTRAMSRGVLNASDYNRAIDRFKVSTDKVKAALRNIEPPTEHVHAFSKALRDLQSTSVLAVGPLSGIGTRIGAFTAISNRSTLAIAGFITGATAAGLAAYKLGEAALTTSLQIQRIESALYASAGSATMTANEFNYVTGVSKRLGLDLSSTALAYSQFAAAVQGTTLEGEKAKKVFEGTATAASALKLSAADTEGIFRALTQMMSKGTVQAEELRGQLGDRIPGAFRDAAAAMGISERKLGELMKKGEVLSSDLLPKLADRWQEVYGDAAIRSATGLQAAINNTTTSQTLFNKALDEHFSISATAAHGLATYTSALDFLTERLNSSQEAVNAWNIQVATDTDAFIKAQTKATTASKDRVKAYIQDVKAMIEAAKTQTIALQQQIDTQASMLKFNMSFASVHPIARFMLGDSMQRNLADIAKNAQAKKEQEDAIKHAEEQLKALDKLEAAANDNSTTGTGNGDGGNTNTNKLNKYTEINDSLQVTIDRTKELNSLPDFWLGGTASLDAFNKKLERGKQLEQFKDKLILAGVSQEVFNAKVAEFNRVMQESDAAEQRFEQIRRKAEALDTLGGNALDSFGTFLEDIESKSKTVAEAWTDMVNSIIKDLQRWALQQQVIQPLKDLFLGTSSGGGVLGSILGSLGSSFSGLFGSTSNSVSSTYGVSGSLGSTLDTLYGSSVTGGGRASGGNVFAGQSYWVGEQGPERFIPNTSGHILSNDASLGQASTIMQVNIYNNTSATVSARQSSDGKSMEITIDETIAKAINSVGSRSNKAVRNASTRIAGR